MHRPEPIGRNETFSRYSSGIDFTETTFPELSEESALEFMSVSWRTQNSGGCTITSAETSMTGSVAEVFTFQNTSALCDDLRSIINIPEMCDVMFLVGTEKVPIYGLKAILATRSRTFFQTLLAQHECHDDTDTNKKAPSRLMSKIRRFVKGSKRQSSVQDHPDHLTLPVPDFEPTVFRQLIQYLHCGDIELRVDNVIGVLNVAESYGVDDLRAACLHMVARLLDFNTIFTLLAAAQPYAQFPLTEKIIAKVLVFIDDKAQTLLRLKNFEVLPKDVAVTVLSRRSLRATEAAKWDAALRWSRRHSQGKGACVLRTTLKAFSPVINFSDIPLRKLSQEILPLGFLQEDIIQQAFSCHSFSQRSTSSEAEPTRRRSMRKQQGTSRLRRVFSTRRPRSEDSGFAVSWEDTPAS